MRTRNLAVALATSALLIGALTAPTLAAGPKASSFAPVLDPNTTKVVDDDGLAGVTDDGSPDCLDGFAPVTNPPGSGQDARVFATIQAAVTAAVAGDNIFVCPGVYRETVTVSTTVALIGPYAGVAAQRCEPRGLAGQATVVGNGDWALKIQADNVVVDGLRFANTPAGGIWTDPTHSGYLVTDNFIANNGTGMSFGASGAVSSNVIENCFWDNNNGGPGNGIAATGGLMSAWIQYNGFNGHRVAAINIDGSTNAAGSLNLVHNISTDDVSFLLAKTVATGLVFQNRVTDTDDISVPGAAIKVSGASTAFNIRLNKFNANHTDGIVLTDTSAATITRNVITGTGNGITISSSLAGAANVAHNRVSFVSGTAYLVTSVASGNTLAHNLAKGIANIHCEDDSTGAGTAGTANTWTHDHMPAFGVSVPLELCN